jgi:hypothetical protein
MLPSPWVRAERRVSFAVIVASSVWLLASTRPNQSTRRWWSHVRVLAGDAMKGRDTGSEGYRKAAAYVASHFARAGLGAAGESDYYQHVPLHAVQFLTDQSSVEIIRPNGEVKPLRWQRQIAIPPRVGTPTTLCSVMKLDPGRRRRVGTGRP